MTTLHVKPADPSMTILMPDNAYQPMPPEGAVVAWDAYYAQMIRVGDLIEIEPEPEQLSLPVGKQTVKPQVAVVPADKAEQTSTVN